MNDIILKAKNFAQKAHDDSGCTYGDNKLNYMVHLEMVDDLLEYHFNLFLNKEDYINTRAAAYLHDAIEDAQKTYNDIMKLTNKEVADIVLAVTDVPAENRLLRHLLTLPKTIRDHRAIILKLCDLGANSKFSGGFKNGMSKLYREEYLYKRPIFRKAILWYHDKYDKDQLCMLLNYVDNCHDY